MTEPAPGTTAATVTRRDDSGRTQRPRMPLGAILGPAVRTHRALLAVLAGFALAAVALPTMTPVALWDDWMYARSVEDLVLRGQLRIHQLSAANLLFQILWSWPFAKLFGMTFGVLRLSTVVLVGLSGWALYGLLRELRVERGLAAMGTALYLFNPLMLVLSYSFMTDGQFTALLVVAAYGYARGLRGDAKAAWCTVAGSTVAGLAFLERQGGAFIVLAVLGYLLLTRQVRPDRRGVATVAQVAAAPTLVAIGYYAWLKVSTGTAQPGVQGAFTGGIASAGGQGIALIVGRSWFAEAMYVGLFVAPLALGAVPALRRALRSSSARGRLAAAALAGALAVGFALVLPWRGARMPYAESWLTPRGLGPDDLVASGRPLLLGGGALLAVTVVCALSALVLILVVTRAFLPTGRTGPPAGAGLLLVLLAGQMAAAVLPSFFFGGPLDRYLLPLLPLCLALALWALRDLLDAPALAWLATAALAVVALLGTHDFLRFEGAIWQVAREAHREGVAYEQLDAGAAWTGYHAFERSRGAPRRPGAPWWINAWARAVDSTYVVSGEPKPGYSVVRRQPYPSLLSPGPTSVLLLRRDGVAGDPPRR
jgi:4-amino-4-deoxy-L-arabinose transferase-like glycosyltransferase